MPITFGTPASGTGTTNSFSTGSVTVASGETLIVCVGVASSSADDVTGVVFNTGTPQNLAQVSQIQFSSGSNGGRIEVWELTSPTAGSATVTINTTGTPQIKGAVAIPVQGAVAGASWRDANVDASGLSTTPSVTVTSAVNDLSVAFLVYRNTTISFTADASPVSEINRWHSGNASSSSHCRIVLLTETGAASTSPSGTLGSSGGWGMIGFNVNENAAPVATSLAMTTQPAGAVTNVAFTTQPAVQIKDQFGANFSQAGTTITAAIATGTGALIGTTTANTDANGLATFTNLGINGTGNHTIQFTGGGLTPVTSATVNVAARVATSLSITTQPSGAVDATPFTTQPVVRVLDQVGDTINDAGRAISAAVQTGTGVLSGTTPVNTNASGIATFTDLEIAGTGAHVLRFSGAGVTLVDSASFNVAAGGGGGGSPTTAVDRRRRGVAATHVLKEYLRSLP